MGGGGAVAETGGRWEVIAASIPLAVDASEAMTTSVEVLVIFTQPTGSSQAYISGMVIARSMPNMAVDLFSCISISISICEDFG